MDGVRLDLHVHSRHSPDSVLSIAEVIAHLDGVGLNGFALTDHNTVAGHPELATAQTRFPGYLLIPGVEVSTREGHLLAYGVSEAPPSHRPVAETVEWVRAHGGVSVLSHPFRRAHGVGRRVAESAAVAAIETVNGHNAPRANRKAASLAARRHLGVTGGSDAHALADLGRAFTQFPEGTTTLEGVVRSLGVDRSTTAGGRGLRTAEWVRYEWRTAVLRLRRGFRPI